MSGCAGSRVIQSAWRLAPLESSTKQEQEEVMQYHNSRQHLSDSQKARTGVCNTEVAICNEDQAEFNFDLAESHPVTSRSRYFDNLIGELKDLYVEEWKRVQPVEGRKVYEPARISPQDLVQESFVLLLKKLTAKVEAGEIIESLRGLYFCNSKRTAKTNEFRSKSKAAKIRNSMLADAEINKHSDRNCALVIGEEDVSEGSDLNYDSGNTTDTWQLNKAKTPVSYVLDAPDSLLSSVVDDYSEHCDHADLVTHLIDKLAPADLSLTEKEEIAFRICCACRDGNEAAESAGMSYGAYRQALMRAREKIKKALKVFDRRNQIGMRSLVVP